MVPIIWLIVWIVSKWIVLRKSNLPGIHAIVPLLGGLSLAKSAGRTGIGIIRMLSAAAASVARFLTFGAAGNYHVPAVDALIRFIEWNVFGNASVTSVDIFAALLLILLAVYLVTHIIVSLNLASNWGFPWIFAVVLVIIEPVGLAIMAFGRHKPVIRYV